MSKLRFRADLRVEIVPPDMVFLLSEYQHYTLTGRAYPLLAPLLNGQRDAEQIVSALDGQAPGAQLHYALHRLRSAGYIVEVTDESPDHAHASHDAAWDAYFELQDGVTPAADRTPRQPDQRQIGLAAFGFAPGVPLQADLQADLTAMLAAMNIPITNVSSATDELDRSCDFYIVLTQDYLAPQLTAFNARRVATGIPWLLVKPVGALVWIGPLFQPGQTACWECLAQRLRRNRRVEAFVEQKLTLTEPISVSRGALPSTLHTALALAATETARWLTRAHSALTDKLVVLDTATVQTQAHSVIKRPQCPVCGDATIRQPHPITLASRPKVADANSGYRTESAQETFERYKHHVSPITGAVTVLDPHFSNDVIHTYVSGDNTSRPLSRWASMRRSLRSLNGGKGIDDMQARVSALCEALERYSGQFEGNEPMEQRTYHDLGSDAIHPERLLLFSDTQYQDREQLNAANPPNLFVPQRFKEDDLVDWSPVWSLTEQRQVFVPTAYCYYGYILPKERLFCGADSNGSAAGSSVEDAILQGFLELVERDAVAIWWYNRVRRPAVVFEHPYWHKLQTYYASIQRELRLLDITTDLGIPVCVAVSRRVDKPAEDIIMGFGAHLDFRIAALRALTEINQMLRPVLNVGADENATYGSELPWEIAWWQNVTVEREPYLAPDARLSPTITADYPAAQRDDLRDDVLFCLDVARKHGMDVLVLNQTRPDIGLPVVKVMAPGIRHFWGRFAPGRLYDVPVQLGWLLQPTAEHLLNPYPMTL